MSIPIPIEGLRYAYLILNPGDHDSHFEKWINQMEDPGEAIENKQETFISVCDRAVEMVDAGKHPNVPAFQVRAMIYASGFFEAQRNAVISLEQPLFDPRKRQGWPGEVHHLR